MILTSVGVVAEPRSDAEGELVEGGAAACGWQFVSYDVVVSAAQVLYERVTCRDDPRRPQLLESAHRAEPGF